MDNNRRPDSLIKNLKDMGFDTGYRDKNPVFGTYICGYLISNDISIRIKFDTEWTIFLIEHMGNTQMNKTVKNDMKDQAFQCFIYILQEYIDSVNNFKKSVESFPEITLENHRDNQLEKLFEKNTYIPLVP